MFTLHLKRFLRKALPFWQEICFIVLLTCLLVSMLIGFAVNSAFRWDVVNIVFFSLFSFFLFAFVGQLFWKNAGVAFVLSIICGSLAFLLFIVVLRFQLAKKGMRPFDFGLMMLFCLGYMFAAVSMLAKYLIRTK